MTWQEEAWQHLLHLLRHSCRVLYLTDLVLSELLIHPPNTSLPQPHLPPHPPTATLSHPSQTPNPSQTQCSNTYHISEHLIIQPLTASCCPTTNMSLVFYGMDYIIFQERILSEHSSFDLRSARFFVVNEM